MYAVYILYSAKFDKSYVGFTSDLINRFKSHNELGSGYTKKFRPWIVVYVEFYETKKVAAQREIFFKSGKGFYERIKIIQDFIKN